MSASYIVRLDDACPTMKQEVWDQIEDVLDRLDIRPIVGVIPDNHDPSMLCSDSDSYFWERVRSWEKKGWSIALHGMHHTCHPIAPDSALVKTQNKSEFVGLSLEKQREILRESYCIFKENRLKPTMFMAPSHTFDKNTLIAIQLETEIRVITDGLSLFPFRCGDFIWVPQQLWRFRWMPFGIWSVCMHPNVLDPKGLKTVTTQLLLFHTHFESVRNRNYSDV